MVILLVVLVVLGTGTMWAQGTGTLTGNVTDPSGALIAGAAVKVTNPATGVSRTAKTGTNGVYVFAQLAPGTYDVEVSMQGFKTSLYSDIAVQVARPTTLNVQMEVGQLAQTVEVTTGATALNTEDASVGNPFTERQIIDLPLEGRNIVGLLSLQPGAVYVPSGDIRSGSINGSRSDQSNFTLDGVDVNDPESQLGGYEAALRMTLDATQEFRTTTSNYNASEGRSGGAQVQIITKRGTNELHGSFYEFHRNTVTSSNEYFNKLTGGKTPKLLKNIFGVSAGGPIIKDRLFIFGNYEGLRQRSEEPVLRSVPSDSLRDGVIIYACANPAQCPGGTVNGLTGTHQVPAGHFGLTPALNALVDPQGIGPNPAVITHFLEYPSPNDPGQDNLNLMGFRFVSPTRQDFNTLIARVDFKLDKAGKHNLFWRGNLQDDTISGAQQFPGQPPNTKNLVNNKGMAVGYDAVLSPTVFNSFRWGFTRIQEEQAGLQTQSQNSFLSLSDLPAKTPTQARRTPMHNLRDDISVIKGNHNLQFGTDLRFSRVPRISNANSFRSVLIDTFWMNGQGGFFVPGAGSCNTPGCSMVPAVASSFSSNYRTANGDLWGLLTRGRADYNYDIDGNLFPEGEPVERRFLVNEYEWYFQDSWHVRPSLTVTLGVRYSILQPPYETNGLQVAPSPSVSDMFALRAAAAEKGINPGTAALFTFDAAGEANGRPGFFPIDYNNWAPRVAAAWSPTWNNWLDGGGKLTVRGGYALTYDRIGMGLARAVECCGFTGSFGLSTTVQNVFGSVDEITGPRFTGLFDIPGPPVIPSAPPGGLPVTPPNTGSITQTIDYGNTTPYAHLLDLSIGRELWNGIVVEVGYVGRFGRSLLSQREVNSYANVRDPQSGMTLFEAQAMLGEFLEEGDPLGLSVGRDTANVPPIPFFENLWSGVAGNPPCDIDGLGAAATATQVWYDFDKCIPGDYGDVSILMDSEPFCLPAGLCSDLGPGILSLNQFCCMMARSTIGWSNYNALQIRVRQPFRRGLQFDFNYTWSHSLDVTSDVERLNNFSGNLRAGGISEVVLNGFLTDKQYANSTFDLRHQVNANWLYELPFGRGKPFGSSVSSVANQLIGNWQMSGLFRWTSGFPFNVTGCSGCFPTSPTFVDNAKIAFGSTPPSTGVNKGALPGGFPSAFTNPADAITHFRPERMGEIGDRNQLRGDGFFEIDFALNKRFLLPFEGHTLDFRWETFNITNTPSFDVSGLNASISNAANFGQYTKTFPVCDGRAGRCMQFSLRYQF